MGVWRDGSFGEVKLKLFSIWGEFSRKDGPLENLVFAQNQTVASGIWWLDDGIDLVLLTHVCRVEFGMFGEVTSRSLGEVQATNPCFS